MLDINSKIETIYGVGEKAQKELAKISLATVLDILYYFPWRYDDWTDIKPIRSIRINEEAVVFVTIKKIFIQRTMRKRMIIIKAKISDESGEIEAIWFNQPFLERVLTVGSKWYLVGKGAFFNQQKIFSVKAQEKTAQIVPIYHSSGFLKSNFFRRIIKICLGANNQISEYLPDFVMQKFRLIELQSAINFIHQPASNPILQKAKRRMAFDELFIISLSLLLLRQKRNRKKALVAKAPVDKLKIFTESLPFKLTNDQRRSAWQIILDMEKSRPMNRLLQGDVGSGKTIVALLASISVLENSFQVAWLAPTEALARQHFDTINKFTGNKLAIGLLTSSIAKYKDKKISKVELIKNIAQEKVKIIIATHALLANKVIIPKLNLLIVDEQHRFGVKQRSQLIGAKKSSPHFLSMTATPIPRTLSLALYGDLDISIIREKPLGRKKIITELVGENLRSQKYNFIEKQITSGRQAFIICPLIEEPEPSKSLFDLDKKSVVAEYKKIKKKVFSQKKVAMLHGKMKPKEKQKVMQEFKNGKIDILVSTAVVEVGIDIANATIMMVEGADKFGLAQLHQFRGRVGRSDRQSYCFLFSSSANEKTHQRLMAMEQLDDGFKLAEIDLKMRGPGIFSGIKQSGFGNLKMASIFDTMLLTEAKQGAELTLSRGLKNFPILDEKVTEFTQHEHLE